MKRFLFGLIVSLGLSALNFACYNDSDTYLTELRDNLDLTNAIIGRFTLYPPEYYQKRIEIQTAILKKDPNNLEAYDNISVAYDRIGKGEEALKWIREKRKHLAGAPPLQLYSTEANEGTFLIVRWIRGHKPGDVTDAVESQNHIEKALKINPNAHFGREFAQLYCIKAMIVAGKEEDWEKYFTADLLVIADKDNIDRKKLRYGIAGMMVLGAAWNVPVFIQAMRNLVPSETQITHICDAKITSLFASDQNKLAAIRKKFAFDEPTNSLSEHEMEETVVYELLSNGEEFQKHKKEWVLGQLANGKHPDITPDFWDGFVDVPPIAESRLVTPFAQRAKTQVIDWLFLSGGCCVFVPALLTWGGIAFYRRRKRLTLK